MSMVMDDNASHNNAYDMRDDDAYDTPYASYTYTHDYYNHYSYMYKSVSQA